MLAPLVAPAIAGSLLAVLTTPLATAWLASLIFLVIGSIVAYPTMFFLFLPGLWILGRVARPGVLLTRAWGTALGAIWVPLILWMTWKSSGQDSGPPEEAFLTFVERWGGQGDLWIYLTLPASGLLTAWVYWALARRRLEHA